MYIFTVFHDFYRQVRMCVTFFLSSMCEFIYELNKNTTNEQK